MVGNTLTLRFVVLACGVGADSRWYLYGVVEPLLARARRDPDAIDLQVSAIVMLWHTADWMARQAGVGLQVYEEKLLAAHPFLHYIKSAAIVMKHRVAERGTREIAESEILEIGSEGKLLYRFKKNDIVPSDAIVIPSDELLARGLEAFRAVFNSAATPTPTVSDNG